jgi:hypothetical protein
LDRLLSVFRKSAKGEPEGSPPFQIVDDRPPTPGAFFAGGLLTVTTFLAVSILLNHRDQGANAPVIDQSVSSTYLSEETAEPIARGHTNDSTMLAERGERQIADTGDSIDRAGPPKGHKSDADKLVTNMSTNPDISARRDRAAQHQEVRPDVDEVRPDVDRSIRTQNAHPADSSHISAAGVSTIVAREATPIDTRAFVSGNRDAFNPERKLLVEPNGSIAHYNAVQGQDPKLHDATSTIIRLFGKHDIVMFGEVHGGKQEYQWLCKLVSTPGFADRVDDIVVEFGNALYQKTVDRYIAGENVPLSEVQRAWRNMIASVPPVSPVYRWFYEAVRNANLRNRGKHQLRLIMGSPPGDWSKIKNSADLAPYEAEREQWYVRMVKDEVIAKHHHALLIMGAGHFLRGHEQALQDESLEHEHSTIPSVTDARVKPDYIERELRAAGADTYLVVSGTNVVNNNGDVDQRFDSWPEPVIASLSGTWVGQLPAQPVISGGYASATPLTLAAEADAMLYVGPCNILRIVNASRRELSDTPYGREIARRSLIQLGRHVDVRYGEVPQCVEK